VLYFCTALVPSDTACLANSPGRSKRTAVWISRELGRQKIVLEKTAAGSVQREEVEWMIAKHKQEVAEIEEEMRAAKDYNAATKQALEKERVEMQKKLAKWETERTELRRGLDEARSSWKQVENKIKLERSKIRPLAPLIAENSNSIVVNASAAGGDAAAFCLITPPIAPGIDKSEMAFASVKFTLHSHDQGKWGFSGSTYHGSHTWFQAAIIRDSNPDVASMLLNMGTMRNDTLSRQTNYVMDSEGWHLQYNICSSSKTRTHTVAWTLSSTINKGESNERGCGTGYGFLSALAPGDRIAVIARAKDAGWKNYVEGVEVQVTFSV